MSDWLRKGNWLVDESFIADIMLVELREPPTPARIAALTGLDPARYVLVRDSLWCGYRIRKRQEFCDDRDHPWRWNGPATRSAERDDRS